MIFDPEGRGEEAIEMGAHSLFIDHEAHPIPPEGKPFQLNGLVNCMYGVTPDMLAKN